MNNFKAYRSDYRYKVPMSPAVDNKQTFAVLDIMYLKTANRKGVLASLKSVEVEQCEGYTTESTVVFGDGNFSMWVKELARKSDKEVARIALELDGQAEDIVAAFISDRNAGKTALMNAIVILQEML